MCVLYRLPAPLCATNRNAIAVTRAQLVSLPDVAFPMLHSTMQHDELSAPKQGKPAHGCTGRWRADAV